MKYSTMKMYKELLKHKAEIISFTEDTGVFINRQSKGKQKFQVEMLVS